MNQPRSLQDLAQMAAERHQLSGRQLALKAQGAGYPLTHTVVNQILAGRYTSQLRSDRLRGLAWLAGVSERTAFAAAGLPAPGQPLADELPDGVDNLSPRARKAVLELIRVLVEAERSDHHEYDTEDHEQEPRAEAGGAQPTQPSPMNHAGVSPAQDGLAARRRTRPAPVDRELAVAADDSPSVGRSMREAQDDAAEAPDAGGEWDDGA
ncbi:hypothetical protein [Kocuria sp. CPCC 205297]|uniref:hypothetical protein n=1 Tax=Kocuria sp. CPCC 205297 TaxID=3073558 RepID=UPI0034D5FB55